jgi:threonine/homoserine/homoserine lactone efflux protein
LTLLWLILKGLGAGLAIAIPVGPVNVLVASRSLAKGRHAGIVSGLGAALADTFYGSIAGFSITFVIQFLKREEFWIRVFGGVLLVGIGVVYFRKPPEQMKREEGKAAHSDFVSTLLLTLTNPTTVLSFLAVLAALGLDEGSPSWRTLGLVGGIFAGSMTWWIVLTETVYRLRDRFDERAICWMNRVAGLAIGAFGVLTFVLGVVHGPNVRTP